MKKLHVKKSDTVFVVAGKDKDKIGEVLKSDPKNGKVLVSGVNLQYKHCKPSKKNMQGGIIRREAFIDSSNVMLYCKKCQKATRIKHEFTDDGKKVRVCRHCTQVL